MSKKNYTKSLVLRKTNDGGLAVLVVNDGKSRQLAVKVADASSVELKVEGFTPAEVLERVGRLTMCLSGKLSEPEDKLEGRAIFPLPLREAIRLATKLNNAGYEGVYAWDIETAKADKWCVYFIGKKRYYISGDVVELPKDSPKVFRRISAKTVEEIIR